MFKTLRARIALLLIAASLPVIAFSIAIGRHEFAMADQFDRDRLVQAAELIASRADAASRAGVSVAEGAQAAVSRDRASRADVAAAIVAADGTALARDNQGVTAGSDWLPKNGAQTVAMPEDARVLKGRGVDGRAYRYVVSPIPGSDATAVVAAPYDMLGRSQTQWLFIALGLPAVMVLSCVGLVMIGLERFVLRWIRELRETAMSYDGARIVSNPANREAKPRELADLSDAFETMSARVEDRSTALQSAIDDRDRLLRELHHRVKNNFQMIASLLALQRQEAPETLSAILRAPEDRVRAMAAAYKVSYASGEIGHVGVAELVRDVAQQARRFDGGRRFDVKVHFPEDAFEVDLDLAVSLALLLTELLAAAAVATDHASVSLKAGSAGMLALEVSGPSDGWLPSSGLSSRLIHAYADQLSTGIETLDGGGVRLVVRLASDKPSIGMQNAPAAARG